MSFSLLNRNPLWLLLAAVLIVFPYVSDWPFFELFISDFRTFNATMFAVWLLVLLGMNLLTGYSGQISLGHAALVLISAYTTAILFQDFGFPLLAAIGTAAAFTAVAGALLLGIPASRLKGHNLAIATFALMIALPQILKIQGLSSLTNGSFGISAGVIRAPGFMESVLDSREWLYYLAMFTAVVMTLLFHNLTRSRTGRAFIALRDSEIGAEQMGVNVAANKALAFGISAFYAGLGGGLFFAVQGFVSPESLGLIESIFLLVAIVLGGLGTILGSVLGALFLTFQAEITSELARTVPGANDLREVILGALLIVVIIMFPRGLAGIVYHKSGWTPKLLAAVRAKIPFVRDRA